MEDGETTMVKCISCNRVQEISSTVQRYRCSGCKAEIHIQSRRDRIKSYHNYHRHTHHHHQAQARHSAAWQKLKSTAGPAVQQKSSSSRNGSVAGLLPASNTKYACPSYNARLQGGGTPGKRALICGVSYKKQRWKLKGSLVDVHEMKKVLTDYYNFSLNDIRLLTEEEEQGLWPTKKNIEDGMKWLVKDCKAGDSLVFYFSGHGFRLPEFDGDEVDGFDETLCPVDFKTQGMIVDNDINSIIVKPLVAGATLHAIVDACHSGTILDLPWVHDPNKQDWESNLPPSGTYKGTSGGLAISLSACEDNQIAADTSAFTKKGMIGAMTYCLIDAIKSDPHNIPYSELITKMQDAITRAYASRCLGSKLKYKLLKRSFYQVPQLSSSEKFDVYSKRFTL